MNNCLNIFFLNDMRGGGTKTFTAHLVHSLKLIGINSIIYKVGNKTFQPPKNFGYGCDYFNCSKEDALEICRQKERCLITSVARKNNALGAELLRCGARTIIHDPLEIEKGHYNVNDLNNPIVIRKSNLRLIPNSIFIPHPYVRVFTGEYTRKKKLAISLTRIARIKHTDWLLQANRELSITRQIIIKGSEDRLYSYGHLKRKFPEWIVGGHGYDQEWGTAQRLYSQYRYSIDLTEIPGDGGGSQYSFLESMDAGAIPILHKSWLDYKGEMKLGYNCLAVSNKDDLIWFLKNHELLMSETEHKAMQQNLEKTLELHDPVKIANKFKKELKL